MPEKKPKTSQPSGAERPPRIAVVVSRYNASVTGPMLEGAIEEYESRGGERSEVAVIEAPGSFELTAVSLAAAESGHFAGVAALGCILKGQTRHDEYLARAVAHGLTDVTIKTGVPVAFGVLTVDTPEQARARAGGAKGNKGGEAVAALLDAIDAMKAARAGRSLGGAIRAATDKAADGGGR